MAEEEVQVAVDLRAGLPHPSPDGETLTLLFAPDRWTG